MVVDKTQFDKYENVPNWTQKKEKQKKIAEFRCAKFSELDAEKRNEISLC